LANYSNALSRALPDVLMPLVSMEDTITMVGLLRMYEYAPRVILLNFFETLLATALEGFVVNQMHFPMVWSPPLHAERVDEIFGDFSVINQTYMENYFTPEEFEYLEPILQSATTPTILSLPP